MRQKFLLLLTILMLALSACSGETVATENNTQTNPIVSDVTAQGSTSQTSTSTPVTADFDVDDFTSTANEGAIPITLNGDSISAGEGVTVNGSIATITAAGTYQVSGTLNDGQLIVETEDKENVTLLLASANIHNESGAPIYVANAEKVIITLVDGTQNSVSDGATYANLDESGEPNAAIFSHDDLTINGMGALTVTANYNNGIQSKDDLKITGGDITVTAVNDGVKGKDSVAVKDGVLTINAGADGIQSTNEDDAEKGYIAIEGGTLNINARDDAINAVNSFVIDGGVLTLSAGDDGIHADASLTINGGEVNLTRSVEGLESALVTINNGNIHLVTSDDGINATSGSSSGEQADSSYVYIHGGYVFVDAGGDGLDSNGNFVMTGGTVIVNGPVQNNNGPLDYNGTFNISGGLLIAVGSSGMAEAPSETSTQYSVRHNFDTMQAAGTLIHIQDASGNDILTFAPTKEFQSVVLSSPMLQTGLTYTIYTGGTANGAAIDGLYANASYSAGTEVTNFTIASVITQSGAASEVMGGGRGGHGGGMPPSDQSNQAP